jgi:hypothetical protein
VRDEQNAAEGNVGSTAVPGEGAEGRPWGDALRHVRPTSALELLDRVFAIWRRGWRQLLALGALVVLPGTALEVYAQLRWPAAAPEDLAALAPWAFLVLVVQLLPLAVVFRQAIKLFLPTPPRDWAAETTPLRVVFPRLVVSVLFIVFTVAVMTNFALVLLQELGPQLASVVLALGLLGVSLWVAINLSLAPVLVALDAPTIWGALRMSWRLMRHTRFSTNGWRDNAYWRFALLMSFPLACHVGFAALVRGIAWAALRALPGREKLGAAYDLAAAVSGAVLDAFLVPWVAISLVALLVETYCRHETFDLRLRLIAAQEVDSEGQGREG